MIDRWREQIKSICQFCQDQAAQYPEDSATAANLGSVIRLIDALLLGGVDYPVDAALMEIERLRALRPARPGEVEPDDARPQPTDAAALGLPALEDEWDRHERLAAEWRADMEYYQETKRQRDEYREGQQRALRDREAVEAEMDRRLTEAWAERDDLRERAEHYQLDRDETARQLNAYRKAQELLVADAARAEEARREVVGKLDALRAGVAEIADNLDTDFRESGEQFGVYEHYRDQLRALIAYATPDGTGTATVDGAA